MWLGSSHCGCAGLLEGAHTGHGLGHEFLRHIQRCRMLVHVLDGTSPDALGDYRALRTELELFNPLLADKPQVALCPACSCTTGSDLRPHLKPEMVEGLKLSMAALLQHPHGPALTLHSTRRTLWPSKPP